MFKNKINKRLYKELDLDLKLQALDGAHVLSLLNSELFKFFENEAWEPDFLVAISLSEVEAKLATISKNKQAYPAYQILC